MITTFRRSLGTWAVRLLFLVLVAAFAVWGVGDVFRMIGQNAWVARIGSRTFEAPEVQAAYQRQMAQVTHMMQGQAEPTPEIRRSVLNQTVDRLVTQAAILQEAQRLGLVVPEDALRNTVYQIPAFKGPNGRFDLATFQTVLRNNGLNEPAFLALMRDDLVNRQLMEAVRAGVQPPAALTDALFDVQNEKRSAELAELPFADAPAPPAPTEAQLQRWWVNHPDSYSSPEYRRIKAVILSPETLSKDIPVTDADLQAAYDQHRADYVTPEKRSAQIVTVPDEAKAKALAETWQGGADWPKMQDAARDAGGSAVELDQATRAEFPSDTLADAVFAAAPEAVGAPVQGALGWTVLRVTGVAPGSERSLDDVREELRRRLIAEKAADVIYDRANKLDNLLASGTTLDQLPDDLGLGAVQGTLDQQGRTMAGQPAPIPGAPELREALVQAAFQAAKGEPPRLTEVQTPSSGGSAYYAVSVEDVTPAAPRPFEEMRDQVRADWTRDAVRHEQEQAVARVLAAVKAGQPIEDAATVAGLTVRRTPFTGRSEAAEGVPAPLLRPLFGLKPGEPAMVETPDGFVVAVVGEIQRPDHAADAAGYAQLQDALTRSIGNDTELVLANALRNRAQPQVNRRQLDAIIQP
jgi:peptidyl-prolyl cis-trans isomerase D